MNAANEEAVSAFLNERICLTEIPQVIEAVMNNHSNQPAKDIETILDADHQARHAALATIEELLATKIHKNTKSRQLESLCLLCFMTNA